MHRITTPTTSTPRSLPFWQAILFFGVPAILVALDFHRIALPLLNQGFVEAGVIVFAVPFVLLLIASLVAYVREGNSLTWAAFGERFRLRRLSRGDWLWTAGLFAFGFLSYALLSTITQGLIARGLLVVPRSVHIIIGLPAQQAGSSNNSIGEMVSGNWMFAIGTFVQLLFGVAGEELWWRGYILPRQESTHGRFTWAIHGVLWCLFHLFKWWEYLALLPFSLAIAFVSQRRRNIWPAIIVHFLFNGVGMVNAVLLVLGNSH